MHGSLGLHYRLLLHFLATIFLDYVLLVYCYGKFVDRKGPSAETVIFIYYCICIALTLLEPLFVFCMHFYEVFTEDIIENLHLNMVKVKLIATVTRLLAQLAMILYIGKRF